VALEVADDGVGFAHTMATAAASATPHPGQPAPVNSPAAGGFGLYSIRERVALLDGSLRIDTGPHGTRVSIHLPRDGGAGSTT
jgi:signal transduction histidine kinase